MGIFDRNDPKDETIALLRDEVAHLREVEKELRSQLIALTSSSAYRLTHPHEEPPPRDPVKSILEQRHVPFTPEYTLEDQMKRKPSPMPDVPLAPIPEGES